MLSRGSSSLKFKPSYWWLVIVVYVACLPSAIIVFNALIGLLSLKFARWLPVIVMLAIVVAYFLYCRRNGNYYLFGFLLPACLVIGFAAWLQPNPIKHIHIPEYALLSLFLYLALKESEVNVIYIFVCAALLGFIDELQQGAHPERYFGWKDMALNASGALIGCLGVRVFYGLPLIRKEVRYRFVYVVAAISILVLIYSFSLLFDVQAIGWFAGVYPVAALCVNASFAIIGGVISCLSRSPLLVIVSFNHAFVVFLALANIHFR